jgi:integrase/recombinase XerD
MATRYQQRDSVFHLESAELKKVIHATESFRDRCILKTFAQTGIRRAELGDLNVRDIDIAARRLRIRQGKGAKQRHIPITEELASDFALLIGRRKSGPVFVSLRGVAISTRSLNRIVVQAGERAEVKNPNPKYKGRLTCYLFRHSFARLWQTRGGSMESLAEILGHSSLSTTVDLYGTEGVHDVQEDFERVMTEIK